MTLALSPQQSAALNAVRSWHDSGDQDRPVFSLFGYAGTGKTTLARYIVEALGVDPVRYAAYTGKATSVLRAKGCDPASTIHSLIYMPRAQARARLRKLREQLTELKAAGIHPGNRVQVMELERAIRDEEQRLESPSFTLRHPQESTLSGSRLLVVDEVSMVNEPMARDLMSFQVPILCLGDPAQLPPVEGQGWFTGQDADVVLTEVHRSALDSPVTRIATAIRSAQPPERGYGVTGPDGDSGRFRDIARSTLLDYDQVLCGTNATRWQTIKVIRRLQGLGSGSAPISGDRIIVLANSGELDVYNGQQFTVLGSESRGRDLLDLVVKDDDGQHRELPVWTWGFRDQDGERRARISGRGNVAAATFAQAVTVHKAQGSQWGSVLVIDESDVFTRMARGHRDERYRAGQRWAYTAATRASERVVLTGAGVVRD